MVKDLQSASELVHVTPEAANLMTSPARPVVLVRAKVHLPEIAPDNDEIGVMLPYTPLHHLLFAAGAPEILVMTSANRSAEPIAYRDDDAQQQLSLIADAFLIGERPIARRIDDSVARVGAFGPDDPSSRARLRPWLSRLDPERSADSCPRRRFEELDHACRRQSGLRESTHRRSRSLRMLLRVPRNDSRLAFDVSNRFERFSRSS